MQAAAIETTLTVGLPTIAVLVGILVNNSRLSDLRAHIDQRFQDMQRYMDARFGTAHQELLRVEGVLDARLRHPLGDGLTHESAVAIWLTCDRSVGRPRATPFC